MKLGLGTVQFGMPYGISNSGDICTDNELNNILKLAHSHQLKIIDTAASYGNAERRLGKSSLISKFNIVSKIDNIDATDETSMKHRAVQLIRHSLTNLCVEHFYGVICHDPKTMVTKIGAKTRVALEYLKEQNICKKIGVSIYEVEDVCRIIQQGGIDLVQLPLNIFDQRFLRTGGLAELKANGIEIHVRSAFLQGLLLMPLDQVELKKPDAYQALLRFHKFANDLKLTPLQLGLNFIQSLNDVDHIIIGAASVSQLQEALTVSDIDIAPNDYSTLSEDNPAVIDPRMW